VRLALARAYVHEGRNKEALAEYDRAIAVNPNYAEAYYGKAIALKKTGDLVGSIALMQKSCELGNGMACLTRNFDQTKKN